MKQPNLAEKIIMMSIEGISIGISSGVRTFISLLLRLLFGASAFDNRGEANHVALRSDTNRTKINKSRRVGNAVLLETKDSTSFTKSLPDIILVSDFNRIIWN